MVKLVEKGCTHPGGGVMNAVPHSLVTLPEPETVALNVRFVKRSARTGMAARKITTTKQQVRNILRPPGKLSIRHPVLSVLGPVCAVTLSTISPPRNKVGNAGLPAIIGSARP